MKMSKPCQIKKNQKVFLFLFNRLFFFFKEIDVEIQQIPLQFESGVMGFLLCLRDVINCINKGTNTELYLLLLE